MKKLYTTSATVTGGRMGTAKIDDSDFEIAMAPPGSGKEGSNPEQLFAMGYGACFDSALGVVKKMQGLSFGSTTKVKVDLLQSEHHEYALGIHIHVIADHTELSADDVQKAVAMAHEVCPYSKATRGNIDVVVTSEIK